MVNIDPQYVKKTASIWDARSDKPIQFQQHYKHDSYKAMAAITTGHEKQKHLEKYCTKTSHAIRCTLLMARHYVYPW
jgi:hypothetical protein